MDSLIFLASGVLISLMGIMNIKGNISTIHSYNRRKVAEADIPKYGRAMGIGTLIIGVSLIVDFVLSLLNLIIAVRFVIAAAVVVGLAFMLYAQFKYNKGIF